MAGFKAPDGSFLLVCLLLLVLYVKPSHAFGAGNIASVSKVEGTNWRHGDIEDVLLSILASRASNKKFSKLDVKRVYFGNWLRDYSQAVDVGALKMVSAEAIRLLLWILGFMSFGYGTKEFEVTTERLGCYRPEEHIDNPKDYADNEDARRYDRRLRGPVDERRELAIDERTGLKMYIASEDQGITTSAGLVRDLYRRCIDLGRRARRSNNDADLYEAFRLMGTANHCLEDYSAHSNFVELCLIEMGERDVFPHVGRDTRVRVRGARDEIWPLITGTFGGVDFLHSVMGEVSDKATQSEIEELEGTISDAERNRKSSSVIQDLLNKIPEGILKGGEADKADELQQNANAQQMQNMEISPKDPEEFTRQAEDLRRQIYPILEFHDNLMREISEAIDKIPILPELLEQFQEQLNVFVFGLIAPYILPVLKQVKAELSTGSSEIIDSSKKAQHIVFNDDRSSDPTHSMIAKDHFSNVLNEPAGKVATSVIKWVVPQIVECWDDERADAERVINRIISGVFHHPALRDGGEDGARDVRSQMFRTVEQWWQGQSDRGRSDLRDKLSRNGVEQGRNHKEGVHDKGHGCGKPLGMPNIGTANSSGAIGGVLGAGVMGGLGALGGKDSGSGGYGSSRQNKFGKDVGDKVGEAVGGGLLGSIVGGVAGGLLGGALDGGEKKSSSHQEGYSSGGGYTQSYSETTHRPSSRRDDGDSYGQSQYSRTDYPSGGRREEYSSTQQTSYGGGSSYQQQSSYESRSEYRQESHSGNMPGSFGGSSGGYGGDSRRYGKKDKDDSDDDEYDPEKRAKKERKKREKEEKKRRKEQERAQYGGGYRKKDDDSDDDDDDDSDDDKKYKKKHGSDKYSHRRDDDDDENRRRNRSREREERREEYGGGRREHESSGYGGGRQEYGAGGYEGGESRREEYGGGRQESSGYGGGRQEYGSSGYGQEQSYGGGRSEGYGGGGGGYGGGRRDDDEGGGYGSRRRDDDEGGYGGRRNDDDNEYGNRRRRDDDESGSYGGSSGYGQQSSGYGGGGGYGGDRY